MKPQIVNSIFKNKFLPCYTGFKEYDDKINLYYNNDHVKKSPIIMNYYGGDTEELYLKNLKKLPDDWYYKNNFAKYTLNSYGYRTTYKNITREFDDIDWKNSIVIFGCSMIFGVGVTDEHTIPHFLEEILGIPVINMGIIGSSIQTFLHNSVMLHDSKYDIPKSVVYAWTDLNRYQKYLKDYIKLMGQWNANDDEEDQYDSFLFNLINIKLIRNLWNNKTIYYEYDVQPDRHKLIKKLDSYDCKFHSLQNSNYTNMARDLAHPGREVNYKIASLIAEDLKILN